MQRKFVALAVMGLWVGLPAAASACDFSFAYHYLGIPTTSMAVGAGVTASPLNGDGDTYVTPAVGVGFRLGERAGVAPIVGYCTGGDEGEVVFGGGGILNVWNSADGMLHLNVQAHAAYGSFDGGSEMTIPVVASILYNLNESTGLFGTAGINHYRISYDGDFGDFDDTNPVVAAGISFLLESFNISTGLTYLLGENDDSIGLIAALSTAIGS